MTSAASIAAQAGKPHRDQHESRQDGGDDQAAHAVFGDDAKNDDHKGAGGSADLVAATAQKTDEEPGNDRRVKSLFRGAPRGDAKGHGQRQGDDADGQSGDQVLAQGLPGVVLAALPSEQFKGAGDKFFQGNQFKCFHD